MRVFGYLFVFVVPALLPLAAWLGEISGAPGLMAWLPVGFLFGLIPLLDLMIGRDPRNPEPGERVALEQQRAFRAITLACLPVQAVTLVWSAHWFVHAELGFGGALGWLISQGVVGGVLAINTAHELIHKPGRLEPLAGGILLSTVGYGGFKIEHLRGHHVHVSTPEDASSARYGTSLYRFLPRALLNNSRNAWKLEARRLAQRGLPAWHWSNEFHLWAALSLLWLLLLSAWLGHWGGVFFVAQAVLAASSLEIINYVEHYGLERRRLADGRYERTTHLHSWNSDYRLTNWMLFQLQRHSDHHETARRRYQSLLHHEDSPQLPAGYAGLFVLALIPPLWFALINPRVEGFRARQAMAGNADA